MTIPVGRRRLVLSLLPPAPGTAPDLPAAAAASDAELVRLAVGNATDIDRARWEAMRLIYGGHR